MTPVQYVGFAIFLFGYAWACWLFPPLPFMCVGVVLMCIERVGVLLVSEKEDEA